MAQSDLREGLAGAPATFSPFCRRLPPGWGYLVSAGLDDVIDALEALRYDEDDLDHLDRTGLFGADLLERLRRVRFTGSVRAMPEGTPFTAGEPVLEVTGRCWRPSSPRPSCSTASTSPRSSPPRPRGPSTRRTGAA